MEVFVLKKYKVLFKIEPLIKIDKPIKINDTVLYYRGENLIAEIYVRASSISEAEKIANEGVSIVVNSLSQELKSSEIKFVSHTTIDIADDEKIIKHAKNDLLTTFTVRVPFTQDMYSKVKRNAELAKSDEKINKVLQLINSYDYKTWVGLYRVFEVINSDKEIINEGWISKTKRENFKRTANHPKASGNASRHGIPKSEKEIPPSNPMNIDDAIELIDNLVEKWLNTF